MAMTLFMVMFIAVSLAPSITMAGTLSTNPNSSGLIPCGNGDTPCTAGEIFDLVRSVLDFIFNYLIIPLAVFAYGLAGFKLIIGSNDPKQHSEGIDIIKNTTIGFVIALGAWVLIKFILTVLGATGFKSPI